ncbi:hypothetical protein, partial [Pseudomonas sp. FW305-BF6]|uniref:glycoside hydrolase family 78 protein n=1 Tax=Pseudomonas sp. FW305-BF6 TaxID=2070673 RepID=UPI001C43F8DA
GNNPGSFTNEDMIFANDGAWMMSDGANWTTWDTTAVIEYTLNTAPNTPPTNNPKGTQTTPAIITTTTPTLDWSFSDSNAGDIQSAYQVRVRDTAAAAGVYVHDTGKVTSTLTDYVVPSGNLVVGKTYTWEVMTWDEAGTQSAWSSPEYFSVTTQGNVGDIYTFNYTGAV